jgi:hypothetical protein
MSRAFVLYQPAHVADLTEVRKKHPSTPEESIPLIALGADVEFLLEDKSEAFISGRAFRTSSPPQRLVLAKRIGAQLLSNPALAFFAHEEISLGELYTFALQDYLVRLFYYIEIATALIAAHPELSEILLFQTADTVSETSGLFAIFEARVVLDAFLLVGKRSNIRITTPESTAQTTSFRTSVQTKVIRALGEHLLWGLNQLVTLWVKRRPIRLLATEHWHNIAPLMKVFPESELILLDRAQSRKAGLKSILAHRMRFLHSAVFVSGDMRKMASNKSREYAESWVRLQNTSSNLLDVTVQDFSLAPLLKEIFDRILLVGGEQAILTIEGTTAMLRALKPDVVLVRASTSAQIHFAVLCKVAKSLGIPSVEVQHGIFYLGEGSFVTNRTAEYIAEYGPRSRLELKRFGYTDAQLLHVGSPRFDAYARLEKVKELDTQAPVIALLAPEVLTGSWNDSYDVADFFSNFGMAVSTIPNASAIIKLRPSAVYADFYESALARALPNTSYKIMRYEPLLQVFQESSIMVTCYSTALLEMLMCGMPTIYDATLPMQDELAVDLPPYEEEGVLSIVRSEAALQKELQLLVTNSSVRIARGEKAKEFIAREYLFDSHASERLASVLRIMAQKNTSKT